MRMESDPGSHETDTTALNLSIGSLETNIGSINKENTTLVSDVTHFGETENQWLYD